ERRGRGAASCDGPLLRQRGRRRPARRHAEKGRRADAALVARLVVAAQDGARGEELIAHSQARPGAQARGETGVMAARLLREELLGGEGGHRLALAGPGREIEDGLAQPPRIAADSAADEAAGGEDDRAGLDL